MYSEYHCFDDAIRLFNGVPSPDLVLWTSIISGFSQSGKSQEALKFYALMWEELDEYPNNYTFSSVLCSCSGLAAVEEGKQIHCQIIKLSSDIGSAEFVSSSLLEMYAKSGYIEEAKKLFNKTLQRDIATWNSMITNLAQHGDAASALEIFGELLDLPNLEPNHITYVGVLSACNHKGLVEEGYEYFKMIKDPTIDHYTCLIDLLRRAGRVAEALSVIEQMPFDPNEIIWSSLLAASALHGKVDLGEYSANRILQLNPKDSGTYVALSNIYAAAGRWNDVDLVRKIMKDQGVRKNPGQNFLTVNRLSRTFLAAEG
ncbi:pentatricopeptide repeat-containing protein At2g37320-like [Papaver somniferum]|nr:pentatricopeptide repeat-containing protein At2g37320-like [Papaver somniferum]